MSASGSPVFKGILSPVERFSEVLFGLIMTLSITGTMSVASGGREEVRTMLLSVLGCNIAWGIIDGVLYLFGTISERGRNIVVGERLRSSRDQKEARALLEEVLPPAIADVLTPDDVSRIQERLAKLREPERRRVVTRDDALGALGVFLLVTLSCVPVIIPFIFMNDSWPALRVSNGIAIVMLFFGGYNFARYAGLRKVGTGLVMVVLGAVMVGLTIALGG